MSIKGKHIVIAGGNSGIGFAIAALALQGEARVTIIGRSQQKLTGARERLGGKNVDTIVMDLGDANSAQAGFEQIGEFDHFISTAADLTYSPLATMATEAIDRMLAGKFWGPVNLVKFGVPKLQKEGSILLFSGLAADRPAPGTAIVSALNAGVEGLTRALAVELAPIRVNAISPGVVDTEGWSFMEESARKAFFEQLSNQLPARRIGEPLHIAQAALFAISAPYLTGEVMHINGGGSLA